jgi:hypothetical protein
MTIIPTIGLITAVTVMFAQQKTVPSGNPATTSSRVVYVHQEPMYAPGSLEELEGLADLIVEGMVDSSTIPPRKPNTGIPNHLETDSVFLVSTVFKGDLSSQKSFPRVVISQVGGKDGDLIFMPEEPLLSQGEKMILFLRKDPRNLPSVAALPRFTIAGIWAGKFRVQASRNDPNKKIIGVPRKSGGLKDHDLEDHDHFVGHIQSAVAAAASAK